MPDYSMMDAIRASIANPDPTCERCGNRSSYLILDVDGAHSLCRPCADLLYPEEPDDADGAPVVDPGINCSP